MLLIALFVLKPLVTALCLASGASGGLFTPTLATGRRWGARLVRWNLIWPGTPSGAYAMLGAAAMMGAAMQAPLTAIVMTLELTGTGIRLAVPMIVATVLARWSPGSSTATRSIRHDSPPVRPKARLRRYELPRFCQAGAMTLDFARNVRDLEAQTDLAAM